MTADILLVDTSAWILSFKSKGHDELKEVLREGLAVDRVSTTQLIVLELLQGCKTPQEFERLKLRLRSVHSIDHADISWEQSYQLGFTLRRTGVTVPTVDMLIACLAIQYGYVLLHHDYHFRMIAKHSELKTLDFLPTSIDHASS